MELEKFNSEKKIQSEILLLENKDHYYWEVGWGGCAMTHLISYRGTSMSF